MYQHTPEVGSVYASEFASPAPEYHRVPQQDDNLPEVVVHAEAPEAIRVGKYIAPSPVPDYGNEAPEAILAGKYAPPSPDYGNVQIDKPVQGGRRSRPICGLAPKVFFLVVAAVILVAAIVGGVVGGVLGSRKSTTSTSAAAATAGTTAPSADNSTSPITSGGTPTTKTSPTQTLTEVGQSTTLYRACPSANDTIYQALDSPLYKFRVLCDGLFESNKVNKSDVVNKPTTSLADCVDLCVTYNLKNKTEIATGKSKRCSAVCWWWGLDAQYPGQCFGFQYGNVSTSTSSTASTDGGSGSGGTWTFNQTITQCDGAAWINIT